MNGLMIVLIMVLLPFLALDIFRGVMWRIERDNKENSNK